MKHGLVVLAVILSPVVVSAQIAAPDGPDESISASSTRALPTVSAVSTPTAPVIDGRLNDKVWHRAQVVDVFTQRDPDEGAAASERTEVRVLYDDDAVYVGVRLHDSRPPTTRLGRRDMDLSSSDWIRVSFDSYFDRRTAYRFDVNPSGVRRDAILGASSGGGGGFTGPEGDLAWDAVWDARASVDEQGWAAELRIPFSQLRFVRSEQTWGLQLERILDRRQELSLFSFTRKSEPGGVAAFGNLTGLNGLQPGRRLEIMPYLLTGADLVDAGGNPFRENREFHAQAGVDARYGITPNLTLTTTVNPDFGQVEVDPAVINLTAFETRFDERRPFFVEGASSFRFAGALGGPSALAQNMFYSRRIGRAPQLGLDGQNDIPDTARILGAAKITGKTASGWSVGVLNAVTGREVGQFMDRSGGPIGRPATALAEPVTNFFVGRLNRELRQGQTTFGPMFTAVTRDVSDPRASSALHSTAFAGGADFHHEWDDRTWNVAGFAVGSRVAGSPEAILRTQRTSTRYLQRPDATSFSVDPTRTSMEGFAASMQFRKATGKHWTGDGWVATTSPGFEMNDLGFQQRADRHAAGGGVRYQELEPGRVLRTWNVFSGNDFAVNWDGDLVDARNFIRGTAQFVNYWSVSGMIRNEPERKDDRFTRGGPVAESPHALYDELEITSDPRRAIGGSLQLGRWRNDVGGKIDDAQVSLTVRTSPRWNLTVGPSFVRARQDAQYVTTIVDEAAAGTFGRRFVFAPLDQKELGLVTRLNYTFTRDLTLELYLQPLVSHADYGAPKEFLRPSGYEFATYGQGLGSITRSGNHYQVQVPHAGGTSEFTVPDRSFTTRSLRGNAVLRWEYRPGSTIFFVWQQERLNHEYMSSFGLDRAVGSLFDAHPNNVFVVKWNYWINP